MSVISELVVKLGIDNGQFNRGLNDANTAVEKTGSKIGGISSGIASGVGSIIKYGALAAAAGAAAISVTGASMLSSASSIQGYRTTLMTLYGDADIVAQKLQFIFKFAATTPFEVPQLINAFVRLKSYGIEGEAALQSIGDAAAAMGKPIELAVEAVADAMTGEFERLKEFGVKAVVLNKDNYEQMGQDVDSIGKTVLSYVDKNGKQQFSLIDRNNKDMIQSTLFSIWNDKYKGGMDAQSKTFSGMVSNIKDSMTQAGLSIMGFDKEMGNFRPDSLFVKISDVTKRIMDYVGSIDWNAIGLKITEWVTTAINIISKLWVDIQPILNLVITKIKELYGWFTDHPEVAKTIGLIAVGFMAWSTLSPIISGVATAIKVFGAAISSSSALVAALGGPITIIILAIGALYLAWSTNFGGLKDKTSEVWTMISPIFNEIKDWLISKIPVALEFLRSTMVTVMGILTKVWTDIGPIIKDAMTIITVVVLATLYGMYLKTKEIINNVLAFWNYFKDMIIPILDLISASIKFAWDIAVAVIGGAMRIIKDIITGNWSDIWTTIEDTCSKIWESIKTYFGSIVTSITGFLKAIYDKNVEIWNSIWDYLFGASIIPEIYDAFVKWFGDIVTAIWNSLVAVYDDVVLKWTAIKDWITTTVSNIWTYVKDSWANIKSTIQTAWDDLKTMVVTVFTNAYNSMLTWITSIWNYVKLSWGVVKDVVELAWDKLKDMVVTVFTNAYNKVVLWIDDAWKYVSGSWAAVKTAVQTAWDDLKNMVATVFTNAYNKVVEWISSAWSYVKNSWSTVKDAITTAWSGVTGALTKPFTDFYGTLQNWFSKLPSWVQKILKGDTPSIPNTPDGGGGGLGSPSWVDVNGRLRQMYIDPDHRDPESGASYYVEGPNADSHWNPLSRTWEKASHSMAEGGSFWTQGPTPLLVGEGGESEFVSVTPLSKMGSSGNTFNFIVQGNVYGVNDLKRHFDVFMKEVNRNVKSLGG